MFADEIHREFEDEVVDIRDLVLGFVLGIVDAFLVSPQVVRVIGVRATLVEIPEPLVEALAIWNTGRVGFTETPFARHAGGVSGPFKELRDGEIFGLERDSLLIPDATDDAEVVAHTTVTAVQTGVEDAPRRGADRGSGVALRESHALLGETIEVGCWNDRAAIAAEVGVSEVVAKDEDDVWPRHGRSLWRWVWVSSSELVNKIGGSLAVVRGREPDATVGVVCVRYGTAMRARPHQDFSVNFG